MLPCPLSTRQSQLSRCRDWAEPSVENAMLLRLSCVCYRGSASVALEEMDTQMRYCWTTDVVQELELRERNNMKLYCGLYGSQDYQLYNVVGIWYGGL